MKAFENIVGNGDNGENSGNSHFLLFPAIFFIKDWNYFSNSCCLQALIVWCLMTLSTVFHLYCGSQCTYPCFPVVLLTSTTHNILSKLLAAFPHDHSQNNGQQWDKNKFCRNDYHQSSERILAEPGIKPATPCSQVCNATNWAMVLGANTFNLHSIKFSVVW